MHYLLMTFLIKIKNSIHFLVVFFSLLTFQAFWVSNFAVTTFI